MVGHTLYQQHVECPWKKEVLLESLVTWEMFLIVFENN